MGFSCRVTWVCARQSLCGVWWNSLLSLPPAAPGTAQARLWWGAAGTPLTCINLWLGVLAIAIKPLVSQKDFVSCSS